MNGTFAFMLSDGKDIIAEQESTIIVNLNIDCWIDHTMSKGTNTTYSGFWNRPAVYFSCMFNSVWYSYTAGQQQRLGQSFPV